MSTAIACKCAVRCGAHCLCACHIPPAAPLALGKDHRAARRTLLEDCGRVNLATTRVFHELAGLRDAAKHEPALRVELAEIHGRLRDLLARVRELAR